MGFNSLNVKFNSKQLEENMARDLGGIPAHVRQSVVGLENPNREMALHDFESRLPPVTEASLRFNSRGHADPGSMTEYLQTELNKFASDPEIAKLGDEEIVEKFSKKVGRDPFSTKYFFGLAEVESEDKVNHPNHYTQGKFECIEVIQEQLQADAFLGFLQGNVVKYLWRWRDKNGIEDLKKAQWYLNKMVETHR